MPRNGSIGVFATLIMLLLPNVEQSRGDARRTQCKNNLRNICLGLLSYHATNGVFPPAYTVDQTGQRLHSWRTLILPYLDRQALYEHIDLAKPWDAPVNAAAREVVIPEFRCPAIDIPANHTTYTAMVGEDRFLHPTRPRKLGEFAGGANSAIAVIEVASADSTHWMEPTDNGIEFFSSVDQESDTPHRSGIHGAFADGSLRFISSNASPITRAALMSISTEAEPDSF